jgi:hypothetical protein
MEFTNSSIAAVGANPAQIPGEVEISHSFFAGTAAEWDAAPNSTSDSPSGIYITDTLMESGYTPFLRIGPIGLIFNVTLNSAYIADAAVGENTPFVDASGSSLTSISVSGGGSSGGSPPLVISGYSGTALTINNPFTQNYGNVRWFAVGSNLVGGQNLDLNNQPMGVRGTAQVNFSMAVPGALSGCLVSAGGSVPVGVHSYSLTALDLDLNETILGPPVSVTTTPGNQTVKCNLPSLPAGALGFNPYRDGIRASNVSCPTNPQISSGSTWVDAAASAICGPAPAGYSQAGNSLFSSNGIASYKFRGPGGGGFLWSISNPGNFTANQAYTPPNSSGTLTITIASGTAVLPTSSIGSGACSSTLTVSASGVLTTDAIISTFNADPTSTTGYAPSASGSLYIYVYPTTNNVNFRVCNNTGSSITPGAATLNFRVVR